MINQFQKVGQWYSAFGNKDYLSITLIVLAAQSAFILPFLLSGDIEQLFRYWDGPNYLLVAKTLYSIPADHPLSPYTVPEYFAAHLPLYPVVIKAFSFMGYPSAMLFTTFVFTLGSTLVFYQLLKENLWVTSPAWAACISLFIPARYLIYHNVGATEAPFIFFIVSSLLFYKRGNYFLAFLCGGLSGITRITGILMGVGYLVDLLRRRQYNAIPLLALIGLPLFLTFCFYAFHYGDFFAYLGVNLSSSNKLLYLDPLKIFKTYSASGDTHSAEFYLLIYGIYALGTALLFRVDKTLFFLITPFYIFNCFIFHQDIARYFIPLAPFSLVVAFDNIFSTREAKILSLPFIVLTYIYAWGMIEHNMVVDWVYDNLEVYLEK